MECPANRTFRERLLEMRIELLGAVATPGKVKAIPLVVGSVPGSQNTLFHSRYLHIPLFELQLAPIDFCAGGNAIKAQDF